MKSFSLRLIEARWFEPFILVTILVNCALIGVETFHRADWISWVQSTALVIFVIEILARWLARDSARSFFTDAWNVFDLSIVVISLVPESLFTEGALIMSIRVLRVFRVLRLLRAAKEIKLIVAVLIRSFSALTYNGLFFFIFLYLFSLIGLSLFKLPDPSDEQHAQAMVELAATAPNAPTNSCDPYGNLGETMFTLFRTLTGEDWTDLRYNLITAYEMNLISSPPWVITTYHVLWFVMSAFLLLNLLVGAILNNYQVIMEENRQRANDSSS
jgi:voltage-gated sodium channel